MLLPVGTGGAAFLDRQVRSRAPSPIARMDPIDDMRASATNQIRISNAVSRPTPGQMRGDRRRNGAADHSISSRLNCSASSS
jgi:hypothetical protein